MATCTGDQYVQNIERTECIGNSLVKINNNFKNLDVAVCETGNDIEGVLTDIAGLLTLINQLSSNMQNIGNYPYARLNENLATAGTSLQTSYANRIYVGKYDPSNLIALNTSTGDFTFNGTGVYETQIVLPTDIYTGHSGSPGNAYTTAKLVQTASTLLIRQSRMSAYWGFDTYNQDTDWLNLSDFSLRGRFTVTSTSDVYSVKQIVTVAGTTLLGGQAEFWKVG